MSNNFIREDNKVETSGQSLSEIQEQKVTTVTPFQELPNSLNTTEGTVRPVTSTTKGTVSDVTSTTTGAVSDVTSTTTTTGAVSDVTSTTTGAVSDVTSTTKGMLNINNLNNNKRIANFRRKLYIIIFVLLVLFVTLIIYLKTKKKNLNYFRCRYGILHNISYHKKQLNKNREDLIGLLYLLQNNDYFSNCSVFKKYYL